MLTGVYYPPISLDISIPSVSSWTEVFLWGSPRLLVLGLRKSYGFSNLCKHDLEVQAVITVLTGIVVLMGTKIHESLSTYTRELGYQFA